MDRTNHLVVMVPVSVPPEDQAFWMGPNGSPKKEWSKSLRTKDRRTAIELMGVAAASYDAERAAQSISGPAYREAIRCGDLAEYHPL